jgi:hypothetical protein
MTLCEKCHNEEHTTSKKGGKGGKRVKTTKGVQIKEN